MQKVVQNTLSSHDDKYKLSYDLNHNTKYQLSINCNTDQSLSTCSDYQNMQSQDIYHDTSGQYLNVSNPAEIRQDTVRPEENANKSTNEKQNNFQPCYLVDIVSGIPNWADILPHDLNLLNSCTHPDPFSILGAHEINNVSSCKYEVSENRNENICINLSHHDEIDSKLHDELLDKSDNMIDESFREKYYVIRTWIKDGRGIECILNIPNAVLKRKKIALVRNNRYKMHFKAIFLFQIVIRVRRILKKFYTCPVPELMIDYSLDVLHHNQKDPHYMHMHDTYKYSVLLSDFDLDLFQSGSCWNVDNLLGSHEVIINGTCGIRFAVWAPNAEFVSVVGEWNHWDARAHPMRKRHKWGVYEVFVPLNLKGNKYGYCIHPVHGSSFIKIDPYAQMFENPPATASIVSEYDDAYKEPSERFQWEDEEWMKKRKALGVSDLIRRQPMAIYEVHLPSWMRKHDGDYLTYREITDRLLTHVKNMNFTHVEFLPVAQHPFEGSWGYQVSGLYAPYSRLGSADDFKFLVNELHKNNIGVFIDFVPAHFCADTWALANYDGGPCYEYADPREGVHHEWGTLVFNFRRNEVRSFLLGAAYHWLRRYHIDGLRIDAVSSMLYKNHMRTDWIPNEEGGEANLQAISLLREMNWVIRKEFPGVFTMAEESTSWKGVTDQSSGLGFDAKWDLGWMNDTLSYLYTPMHLRKDKHNKLTFRNLYVAHEKWILPLSHDEVVNGKGSLLDKCGFSGAPFIDRLRTMKALFTFQVTLPGRPLIFMGAEIAQGREWKESRSIDWHEGEEQARSKTCIYLSDLLKLYQDELALHAGDDESWNFQWTDCNNNEDMILSYLRSYSQWYNDIVVVLNFSSTTYHRYPIGVVHGNAWSVLLNSDDWKYGGDMNGPGNGTKIQPSQGGRVGWPYCLWLDLPPFGALVLKAPQPDNDTSNKK